MNIIVTGASRGIGFEIVKILSLNSANTIFAIARNQKKLKELKISCLKINPKSNVIPLDCDISDSKELRKLFLKISKNTDSINVLINNAGTIINKPFVKLTLRDLENVYKVNVYSVIQLIQAFLPIMETKTKSHIVNISSMGGFQGSVKFAGLSAYSSSKSALICLTECLAEEFKELNIAFNCLALGAVQTEMLGEAFPNYEAPVSAKDMASYISEFALTAQKFINGKILPVSLSTP